VGEAKKDPWSQIRHDLRTPINQILGYSELLQEQAEESGQAALVADLQKIQAAARRLLELVEEHLAPEKLKAREAAPAPRGAEEAAAQAAPATAFASSAVEPDAPAPAAGTLLVVDDNEMNRDMLSRRLEAKGFRVLSAADGPRALDVIQRGRIDLVLLDVMMPGLSGTEVLKRVRERASAADLPIIMATAKADSEDVVEALKAGANDYVTKPLDFKVVLARIESQLALKRARQEIQRLAQDLELRNRFIRNTFGRYLSEEIVSSLLETPEGLKLGGERRVVTILMSDLRGFTSVAERLAPEQVVKVLNHYLGAMADVIMRYRGTIDEFIGDAILVIFGAPIAREDDAQRAVACAAAMQLAMAEVNAWNRGSGLPEVEMGIALNTGEAVVGNIGSSKRAKYGVVGTTVNLASRIESNTVGGQVLISESTLGAAGPLVSVAGQMSVRAKGASEPIVAYDLRGIAGDWNVFLPEPEHTTVRIEQPISVRFSTIEGKRVADTAAPGLMVGLSTKGAVIHADGAPPALTNLKLAVLEADGREVPGDLYAKVLPGRAESSGFGIRFTSMPPEVEVFLRKRLR
jgi:class 3 adenylate cyclase